MDALHANWFSELNSQLWPGQCLSLQYQALLEDVRSEYQHIQLFQRYDSVILYLVYT
jgi:spermidine synthase